MSYELYQVVAPDGTYDKAKEPKLSDDELLEIHRTMVLTRSMNERGMSLQRQGRIGFYIGSEGQEAAHIGAGYALEREDLYCPHYRDLGLFLLRGAPLSDLVAQLFGNAGDPTKGRQMPNHFSYKHLGLLSVSSPLSTQIPQAVGMAYAARYLGHKKVAMVSFGDGSTSEGDFHVGMNFAGVWKAPVVFLCQNNQWAISVPLKHQTASPTFAQKAEAYGFPGVRVDGNDVLAVYAKAKEAVDHARAGKGPTLIEAVTYRMGPHSSSDDPTRYVPKADLEAWRLKDPLVRFEKYLVARGVVAASGIETAKEDAKAAIQKAVESAEGQAPEPPLRSIVEDVFADVPWHLEEQIREFEEGL
ncbi:MAG: thiamine pyrophosphate-dependent dehydrogenase E1 component subunit alpha [Methanobacteriota archaeon]